MGLQAAQRLARRETKRTLGNHLKDFAANQGRRLEQAEASLVELRGALNALEIEKHTLNLRLCAVELALEDDGGAQHTDTQRLVDAHQSFTHWFSHLTLFGRLRWFARGRR